MTNLIINIILAFTLLLSLAACAQVSTPAGPEQAATNTPEASEEKPSQTPPVAIPEPTKPPKLPYTVSTEYPAPGTPVVEGPLSEFIEGASLTMTKGVLPRPVLILAGNLPTPCHKLAYKVAQPDKDNQVFVSLAITPPEPGVNCIQVISPVELEIPLGTLASGTYTVFINSVKVGSITVS